MTGREALVSEAPNRSRTRLDPAIRRRQIAAAAARVFNDHDPSSVPFERIADEAGVSRSLVYSYFGDRGNLFAAVYDHELELLDVEIDGALESLGSDRDRLARAVSAYVRFALRYPKSWDLVVAASYSRHPAVRRAVQARTDRIAASVARGPETRLLVRGVMGMFQSAVLQALETHDADPDALAELLTTVIWDGMSSVEHGERGDGHGGGWRSRRASDGDRDPGSDDRASP